MKEKREKILADPEATGRNRSLESYRKILTICPKRSARKSSHNWKTWLHPLTLWLSERKSFSSASSSVKHANLEEREVERKLVVLKDVLTKRGVFTDPKMKLLLFTEHKDTLDFLAGDGKEDAHWENS